MNRRNFLKSITTVCGAAVVCPAELLKGKSEHEIMLEKFRAAFKATKFKPPVKPGTRLLICYENQRLCWKEIFEEEYYEDIQTTH